MELGVGSFRVLVGLASMVPLGLVGIPPVRIRTSVALTFTRTAGSPL